MLTGMSHEAIQSRFGRVVVITRTLAMAQIVRRSKSE
jgi:hypothetical protein